jgi:hypothetical protein
MEAMHGVSYGQVLGDENRAKYTHGLLGPWRPKKRDCFCVDTQLSYTTSSWAGSNLRFWYGGSAEPKGRSESKEQ